MFPESVKGKNKKLLGRNFLCEHCRGEKLLNLFIPSGASACCEVMSTFFYLELITEQCNLLLSIWIPLPGGGRRDPICCGWVLFM